MAESNLDPEVRSWAGARGVMQLMPMTFCEIQSKNPEFESVDDPVWNIAAGIYYDHQLWTRWNDPFADGERIRFVLGSYNAGRGTLLRARSIAMNKQLDPHSWTSIRTIAPEVPKWRHQETLTYIERIETNHKWLCLPGREAVVTPPTHPDGPRAAPLAIRPDDGRE